MIPNINWLRYFLKPVGFTVLSIPIEIFSISQLIKKLLIPSLNMFTVNIYSFLVVLTFWFI